MDLEKVALEAVKIKIGEMFDKISVSTEMDGKDIVIRIKLADEIMNRNLSTLIGRTSDGLEIHNAPMTGFKDLDKDAQAAADELLGTQTFIPQE